MDRIIFKKEIDRLYEKLYSINESLSSFKSKEFIKGFNDGIREGFKLLDVNEWNPFKSAAGAIGTAVGAAKGLYQQGKQLAGKVWSTVADFATQTFTKVKIAIQTATQWIKTQPGKIKAYLEGIYNGVVADMTSAYNTLKDKAEELTASIGKMWTDITTTITTTIASIKDSLTQTEQEAKAWFETNKQIVLDEATSLSQSTKDWLKEMGTKTIDIVTKVGNGTLTALKGISLVAMVITLGPIWILYKGVMVVPDLYKSTQTQVESAMTQLGNYWSQQKQAAGEAYAGGFNKGMSATGVSVGKIPIRNPITGKMEPSPVESLILKFDAFVNEKKGMNKADFLEMIKGKGKGKGKKGKKDKGEKKGGKEKCITCGKRKKCKCS